MQIRYRLADLDDLDEICSMVQNAIAKMIQQNILQWDELYPTRDIFQEDIAKEQLYVGILDNQIAVIYVLNQEYDEAYKDGHWKDESKSYYVIHRLCVNPTFQNIGVGTTTMQHIETELLSMGIEAIRLDTFTENTYALKLYDMLGYSKVGYADWRKGRFYLMEKYLKRKEHEHEPRRTHACKPAISGMVGRTVRTTSGKQEKNLRVQSSPTGEMG